MKIDKNALKSLLGAALALAMLAGCTTSAKKDDAASGAGGYGQPSSGAVIEEGAVSGIDRGPLDSALLNVDTIFYFDFDKSELSADIRARLDDIARKLRNLSGIVRLEGHADERGTREYNLALGERRARAIANYLAVQGLPSSQIESISYGEEKPAVAGNTDSAWAKNRRVELIYID